MMPSCCKENSASTLCSNCRQLVPSADAAPVITMISAAVLAPPPPRAPPPPSRKKRSHQEESARPGPAGSLRAVSENKDALCSPADTDSSPSAIRVSASFLLRSQLQDAIVNVDRTAWKNRHDQRQLT